MGNTTQNLVFNSRLALTQDETDDDINTVPSGRATRMHTTPRAETSTRMRWVALRLLGRGAQGTVHECVNVDTGYLMAVKSIQLPNFQNVNERERTLSCIKREVETISRLNHISDVSS